VLEGPAGQGLDRTGWTHAELAEHLRSPRGIAAGNSAMQAFCVRHGTRPYRPTYRSLRGDPAKQARARAELAELKRGPNTMNSCC
jgi:transposase